MIHLPVSFQKTRSIPRAVGELLSTLHQFRGVSAWERDHIRLADSVAGLEPFTLILFTEPLAQKHSRSKHHVEIERITVPSELDETVWEKFGDEINERMSVYLQHHRDPRDVYLRRLIRRYYHKAEKILAHRHPRTWRRLKRSGAHTQPSTKVQRHRKYDMPEPLGLWGSELPQQFFFMSASRTFERGCSSGSGSREVQSYFGLAFSELAKRQAICSYVFIYDRDNRLRLLTQRPTFLLLPDSMGSNCSVDSKTVSEVKSRAWKVGVKPTRDHTRIEMVRIYR